MSRQDLFVRVVASTQEAALGRARWTEAAVLINGLIRTTGNALSFGEGRAQGEARVFFLRLCHGGQRREDLEREYFRDYWPSDESISRIACLPDGKLVPIGELFTDREKKTSRPYMEGRGKTGMQNGLAVRLGGGGTSNIVLNFGDSLEPGGWSSEQTDTIRRLLPHLRQFVRVRRAVSDAGALGSSLSALLENGRYGIIQLDRKAHIVDANDRALAVLKRGEGLSDGDGFLSATTPRDNRELQRLLARALTPLGVPGSAGSMTVARPSAHTRLVVHVTPVSARPWDFRATKVAALVLIVDPESRPAIDIELVQSALGLTPAESQLAIMVAAGQRVRDIAALTGRTEGTVRWHLNNIFHKQDIAGQGDLARRVLSLDGFPANRRR